VHEDAEMTDQQLQIAVARLTAGCLSLVEHHTALQLRASATATAQAERDKLLIALRVLEREIDKVSLCYTQTLA
jgi:hypothetical protein